VLRPSKTHIEASGVSVAIEHFEVQPLIGESLPTPVNNAVEQPGADAFAMPLWVRVDVVEERALSLVVAAIYTCEPNDPGILLGGDDELVGRRLVQSRHPGHSALVVDGSVEVLVAVRAAIGGPPTSCVKVGYRLGVADGCSAIGDHVDSVPKLPVP
jgi:hypothetical protein